MSFFKLYSFRIKDSCLKGQRIKLTDIFRIYFSESRVENFLLPYFNKLAIFVDFRGINMQISCPPPSLLMYAPSTNLWTNHIKARNKFKSIFITKLCFLFIWNLYTILFFLRVVFDSFRIISLKLRPLVNINLIAYYS